MKELEKIDQKIGNGRKKANKEKQNRKTIAEKKTDRQEFE